MEREKTLITCGTKTFKRQTFFSLRKNILLPGKKVVLLPLEYLKGVYMIYYCLWREVYACDEKDIILSVELPVDSKMQSCCT